MAARIRRAPSEQRVRLRDVARAAGVSTASASRALNFPEAVSETLGTRITAAAKRLGYLPNPAARALVTRRSGLVGILLESLGDPLSAALLEALEEVLRRESFGVALAVADHSRDTLGSASELLRRGVDAVLSWQVSASAEAAAAVAAHGKPWLALDNAVGKGKDAMGRGAGVSLACRYLRSLGHQRIGVIAGGHRKLKAAVLQNLAGTGAELLAPDSGPGSDSSAELQRVCAILLEGSDYPTAIACASDLEALAVLRECRARAIDVPGDLSVTGFGDTELARQTWPSLTTARVMIGEFAVAAVATLVATLANQPRAIPEPSVKLVVRESTKLAPS